MDELMRMWRQQLMMIWRSVEVVTRDDQWSPGYWPQCPGPMTTLQLRSGERNHLKTLVTLVVNHNNNNNTPDTQSLISDSWPFYHVWMTHIKYHDCNQSGGEYQVLLLSLVCHMFPLRIVDHIFCIFTQSTSELNQPKYFPKYWFT